jgi:hypothetical protein
MTPVSRTYTDSLIQGGWTQRGERAIVFDEDKIRLEERFKEIFETTEKEDESRNPKYGPDHRFRPEDYEDLKERREEARNEHEKGLRSLPLTFVLLGCRDCGYVERRVGKKGNLSTP